MKILVISQYFYPENFRINDFVESLSKKNHSITVLTAIPNYPSGKRFGEYKLFKDKYKDIDLIRIPIFARGSNKFSLFLNYVSFFISAMIFYPILIGFRKFDHVFCPLYSPPTNGFVGMFACFISKAKLSIWIQDLWPESLDITTKNTPKLFTGSLKKFMKILYNKSSMIFIQSEMFKKEIKKYDIDESKIIYFPNWAENIFKEVDKSHNPRNTLKRSVLFAGNIGEAQNMEFILDLVNKSKNLNLKWVFVGDGSKYNWLKKEVSAQGLSHCVEILGRKPLEEMPNLFNNNDFMLVSLKNDEIINKTLPGKVQSYMISKKPIIGIIGGEAKRVIETSDCGIVLDVLDADRSFEILKDFLNLKQSDHIKMGKNGYKFYRKNFDKDVLINRFDKLIS